MMTTLSLLAALDAVTMVTSGAISDDKVGIMTSFMIWCQELTVIRIPPGP